MSVKHALAAMSITALLQAAGPAADLALAAASAPSGAGATA